METQHTHYQNDHLDKVLISSFDKLTSTVKLEAPRCGLINQPALVGGHMAPLTEWIHLACQQLVELGNTGLPANAISSQTAEQEKSAENQCRALQNKSAPAREQQAEINSKIKNTPHPINLLKYIVTNLIIIGICLFDGMQTRPVYEAWGFNLIEATIAACLFASVLGALAHTFIPIISLGRTLWQRRLIAIALTVLLIMLFTYMGNVRAESLSDIVKANAGDAMNIQFSAIPFILTSLLLFVVVVAICHFYMPSQQQHEALRSYYRMRRQKKNIDKEVAQFDLNIQTIQRDIAELKINREAILSFGTSKEESIINHAKASYDLWKRENLFHREDKGKPDCFDEPYPFIFKTYFLKSNN